MQAQQVRLQSTIGQYNVQYLVPLFQRPYRWGKTHWKRLWDDIVELLNPDHNRPRHFMGSVVSLQMRSIPEGVTKFSLIDGQQRLTTFFLLFAAMRDLAREFGDERLFQKLSDLIVNKHEEGLDRFKLLPTEQDRLSFCSIIDGRIPPEGKILEGYEFFKSRLKNFQKMSLDDLQNMILSKLIFVSITLDPDDNAQLVFESLNWKGEQLTQADLVRNYIFMCIHRDEQSIFHEQYWRPAEQALGERMTDFLRHYLAMKGTLVRQSDIYGAIKEKVDNSNVITILRDLHYFSLLYNYLIIPNSYDDLEIRESLQRLNQIEVTVAYPVIMQFLAQFKLENMFKNDLLELLFTLENYLIRRFICSVPTYGRDKVFFQIAGKLGSIPLGGWLPFFKGELARQGYPRDETVRYHLEMAALYGKGERGSKCRLILERLERWDFNKEKAIFDNLQIEHIMPQTLTEEWKKALGDNAEEIHDTFLHTLGNLTLSGYNQDLSNSIFEKKKEIFLGSNLSLNKWFEKCSRWGKDEIQNRRRELTEKILEIWPDFSNLPKVEETDPTGTKPQILIMSGQRYPIVSWRDVLVQTFKTLIDLAEDDFLPKMAAEFPYLLFQSQGGGRRRQILGQGYYLETNHSAKDIYNICRKVWEFAGFEGEDFQVEYS